MYFIPEAIAVRTWAPAEFWTATGRVPANFPQLTIEAFLGNLLPCRSGT